MRSPPRTFTILGALLAISVLNAQQPLGLTKHAREVEMNNWEIRSDAAGNDGSRSGNMFIDNYPQVQIDKNNSWWGAGYLKMNAAYDYHEPRDFIYDANGMCPTYSNHFWPCRYGSAKNRSSYFSTFFQLFHVSIGGYMRNREGSEGARYRRIFFTMIIDSTTGESHALSEKFDGINWTFDAGDSIKYVMAFVKAGDRIGDDSIPDSCKSGMFLYFDVRNNGSWKRQNPDPLNNICYNASAVAGGNDVSRVFLGSTSHGYIQNWEPSVSLWERKLAEGEIDCADGYVPYGMNPLLGNIRRMVFVQGVLDVNDVNAFFDDPLNFDTEELETANTVCLDFPDIIYQNPYGYSLAIPFAHWEEFASPDSGKIQQNGVVHNLPGINGARAILRAKYTGTNTVTDILKYGITYDVASWHNPADRGNFKSIAFFIRDWKWPHHYPVFKLGVGATIHKRSHPTDTLAIYFELSAHNENNGWIMSNSRPCLQGKLTIPDPNDHWYHYNISLDSLLNRYPLSMHPSGSAYDQIKALNWISLKGRFDLADLILTNRRQTTAIPPTPAIAADRAIVTGSYPNPFNASTTIFYSLPLTTMIELTVYNMRGQKITTLVDEVQAAGDHTIVWHGENQSSQQVASGVYLYRLKTGLSVKAHKMLLIR